MGAEKMRNFPKGNEKKERCEVCKYKGGFISTYGEIDCHRHAPVIDQKKGYTSFPRLHQNSWCGDFKKKEDPNEKS